jgi:hypothetical protein
VFGSIAPITINRSTWALTFAHQEEAATFASAILLVRFPQRELSLVINRRRLDKPDTFFVYTSTVASLPVPLDSSDSLGRIWIAGVPDARRLVIFKSHHVVHVSKKIVSKLC